ncbi:MAG: hypothetical protein JWN43_4189 [Gammaproteobacteria bacterium]|nr:hypothetical protein [Gammaproteobacteria bacterium]
MKTEARILMTVTVRIAGAIAAGLVLAACAAAGKGPGGGRPAANRYDPTCLPDTGLPAGDAKCSGFGRSYSSEDIRRTGATTVGEALPLLDPSITVHR